MSDLECSLLTDASIIERACARAGFGQFDSESFREGLQVIISDIKESPHLSHAGRIGLEKIFVGLLVNRLRVSNYYCNHPELTAAAVSKPIFVIGAPRTGTTLVQHLLGTDRLRRSLLKWEIRNSVPPPEANALYTDVRCLQMKLADAARPASRGGSSHLHYEAADSPSECTFLHGQDFKSHFLEALFPAPTYSEWILQCDIRSAYQYQKRVLQILQSKTGGIWALKMPSHALHIGALLDIFPDARIVWTHRDPLTALASLCSTIAATQSGFCTTIDRRYIGRVYSRQMVAHLERPLVLRNTGRHASFHDLYYDALVADPIGEMRRLYDWLGDAFTSEIDEGMRRWLAANPQGRYGQHTYALEQYGLTEETVRPLFDNYLLHFPKMATAHGG